MILMYFMGIFIFSVQSCLAMIGPKPQQNEALVARAECPLAKLPNEILEVIAECLPRLSDVAHVRRTCKLFNETFCARTIRLGPLQHSRRDKIFWEAIYSRIAQLVKTVAETQKFVSLDLSGNSVEQFMYARYPACLAVKKLYLVSCRISSERDNFFAKGLWNNLELLDLSKNYLSKRDKQIDVSGDWDSGADIWPSLVALPKLKSLSLRENQLEHAPQELLGFAHLEYIDLSDNPLQAQEVASLRQKLPNVTIYWFNQATSTSKE